MKGSFPGAMLLFIVTLSVMLTACTKKIKDCKTCKALARGPDEQTVEKKVCSSGEEQDFRTQYVGHTITCE